jgi:hypothetical protein
LLLVNLINGVTGGFAALQGAMSLLGDESEDVQKSLLKVQAALAISQGLNQVTASIDAFKNLATVIGSTVVNAFKTLQGAMAATGIVWLIAAVATLITYFKH